MPLRTIAVVGGGRMGEAIVAGLLQARAFPPSAIAVAEPDADRRRTLADANGVRVFETGAEAAAGADALILAVKPQVIDGVVAALAPFVEPGTIVVSIAAGVPTRRLEAVLPAGTPVVRVMPNAPAMVHEGMSAVSGGDHATVEQVELVRALFGALGEAVVIEERLQDAATAISGSGPAYFAVMVDALADAGVAQGLERGSALVLAIQTMKGTAEFLQRTGSSPATLVEAVSSPGGTTVAALDALDRGGFRSALGSGVAAAVARAKELGS